MNNIQNLSTEELRIELTKIIREYRFYPGEITLEYDTNFRKNANNIIAELNKRISNDWLEKGGVSISKYPTRLTLQNVMQNTR